MGDLAELRRLYEDHQGGRLDEAWAVYQTDPMADDAEWQLYGALTAWRMGDRYRAKQAAERGLEVESEGVVTGKLRFVAGSVLREMGDNVMAIEYLCHLMDHWDDYPGLRPLLEGAALHNLGLAYRGQRKLTEALEACRRAATVFQTWGDDEGRRQAVQNGAWVLCEMGDGEGAREALHSVAGLCREGAALQYQQLGLAYVALVTGNLPGVIAITGAILDSHPPRDVLTLAAWLRGRGHLAGGNLAEAGSWGLVAQDWAAQTGEARLMNYATDLMAAVRERRQKGA